MDAQQFLAEFGHIASAPEGVQRLREMILAIAVQGRLISETQRPDGATARELVDAISRHKLQLAKAKQIGKQSTFSPVTLDEYPFPLPDGWVYVRLGEIANKIGSGSTPRGGREVYVRDGIPFLRSQNVWNDGLRLVDVAYIGPSEHERMANTAVLPNDILLNITGASLGRCALVPHDFGDANVSQHVTIIRLTNPELRHYLHLCILSPYVQKMIWTRQVGMAREGLSKKVLEQFEIPLPPLNEQARIVAKVKELMALCDKLEDQQREQQKLRGVARASTLNALILASNSGELKESWQRLQNHLPLLLNYSEDVVVLRKLILQLGITGRLSVKKPDDSPAYKMVTIARSSIDIGVSKKDFRRPSAPIPIDPNIISYFPKHWTIVRLCQIAVVRGGKRVRKGYSILNTKTPYVYIRVTDMKDGTVLLTDLRYIDEYIHKEIQRYIITVDDLYITIAGTIGDVGTIPQELDGANLTENAARITPFGVNLNYLKLALRSAWCQDQFSESFNQMAQPKLALARIEQTIVPIPPIEEQQRITRRVTELTQLCDQLEKRLIDSINVAQNFAAAAVGSVTGIRTEEEEELKAPKTELISKLRIGITPTTKEQAPLVEILARHNGEMPAKDLWQRYGGEIDAFYQQLKVEVGKGWILEPEVAEMRTVEAP